MELDRKCGNNKATKEEIEVKDEDKPEVPVLKIAIKHKQTLRS